MPYSAGTIGVKNEVLGLRFNMEVADRSVHMDTSHYQRLSVIEITFLCKFNVASGSFEMVSVFPTPPPAPPGFGKVQIVPRVFDLSSGIFNHPRKSFKTEDFLVSQENSNLHLSLERVLIVISPHKQFFLGHPLPPKLSLNPHGSVNKTIEIHWDFRLLSWNNPWI